MGGWPTQRSCDAATWFRYYKEEQREGPYWVISSSGPKSTHAAYKVDGPGVVIGRKGSLGTVFRTFAPYWPHDTTLWVKDFHGYGHLFAYFLLRSLDLGRHDSGAANPTLNRNHIHTLPLVCHPREITGEFERHAGIMMRLADALRSSNEKLRETRDLLLQRLISGEIDVDNLTLPQEGV
jgi:type I restriction enzyme S subunit